MIAFIKRLHISLAQECENRASVDADKNNETI